MGHNNTVLDNILYRTEIIHVIFVTLFWVNYDTFSSFLVYFSWIA